MSITGFPVLVYDREPANLRCTACNKCAKECPTQCIKIIRDFGPDGRPMKKPMVFDVDMSVCRNCAVCEQVCPFDAIFLDPGFKPLKKDDGMVYHKQDLARSNEHLHKVRPVEAQEADRRIASGEKKPEPPPRRYC